MVRKMKKILVITAVLLVLLMIFSKYGVSAATLSEMAASVSEFSTKGNSGSSIDTGEIVTEFSDLAKILTSVGAGILAIVITYMGIKYFMSSPEEQAKLKGQLIGVVVSGVVIFGAVSIWSIAINIFKNM